jgi:hypothetical protein
MACAMKVASLIRRSPLYGDETALVPQIRSSHKFAERSDANFGFRSGTTRIEVASVLIDSEVRTSAPQMLTNFGIGTLGSRRERNCGLFARTPPVRLQFACSIAPPCRILSESL